MDGWTLGSDSEGHCPVGEGSAGAEVTPGSRIAFPEGAASPRCPWTVMQCFLVLIVHGLLNQKRRRPHSS